MIVRIDEIQIKKRARHEMGNINDLAASMKEHGLMNPIVLTEGKVLISGHRRLNAAKKIGWKTIEARMIPDLDDKECLEMEIDENLHRKDFTPDELVDAFHRLEKLKNPGWFRKFLRRIKSIVSRILKKLR